MHDRFRIPDPETRAKSSLVPRGYANANLKAASRLLDLFNLELDEARLRQRNIELDYYMEKTLCLPKRLKANFGNIAAIN
jgi:hypothetical protein